MIDKVKLTLKKELDNSLFENNNFNFKISKKTKAKYFYKTINNVSVLYFVDSKELMVSGRIIYLYNDSIGKVKNFDDVMINEKVSFNYIQKIIERNLKNKFFPNNTIMSLINLDEFNVNYIEYCVNLRVGTKIIVNSYIQILNLIFIDKNDDRYINFVLESNKELHTSSYIKSKRKYELNSKIGTTINFYNKYNQLRNQDTTRWKPKSKQIHKESLQESKGILRLEVKYGSQILYQFRKNDKLSFKFKDYKSIDFAYKLIINKYSWFYKKGVFVPYEYFKEIILESYLSETVKNNTINEFRKYFNILCQELATKEHCDNNLSNHYKYLVRKLFGIHHVLIPKKLQIPILDCPVHLLEEKLDKIKSLNFNDQSNIINP